MVRIIEVVEMICADRVKRYRKETLKITQKELAKKISCNVSWVSQIETGYKTPSKLFIDKISSLCAYPSRYRKELYLMVREDLYEKWLEEEPE